jgi:hypothetical protein
MHSKIGPIVISFALIALAGAGAVAQSDSAPAPSPSKSKDDAPKPTAAPRGAPVFGEVAAVRGNVLQMRTPDRNGLTRVVLAANAMMIRDDVLKLDALKPGMKVSGAGLAVEGTGTGNVPLKVEVQTLNLAGAGDMAGFFGFGGGPGPLMRGQSSAIFHKNNYAGTIGFDARVKTVDPLVLVDEQGNPLPVVIGADLTIHQRAPHPIKAGDITAGAQLLAMGAPTPDGLLSANTIILMSQGSDRGSMSGTVIGVDARGITVRPRFEPRDLLIEMAPEARIYAQEPLDLDTIEVGAVLNFSGKVLHGTAKAPEVMVVQSIAVDQADLPNIDDGDSGFMGMFGSGTVTAKFKGKVTAFDPLKVEMEDGHEVTMKVPGQLTYVRYHRAERSELKAGQKVVCSGKTRPGGLLADVVVLTPAPAHDSGN